MRTDRIEVMTVGGGRFWCLHAIFQKIEGVIQVTSGFSGGNSPGHPTYNEVRSGLTGHTEVVQIEFDFQIITYEELLVLFMILHDPAQVSGLKGKNNYQYRSVIFYHSNNQKEIAQEVIKQLGPRFKNPIVTEIIGFEEFYPAEVEHQDYYLKNKNSQYSVEVIEPKLQKLEKMYHENIKKTF